jgi:hypothetical protein
MAKRTIHAAQLVAWLQKIDNNIDEFNIYSDTASKEEKLEYIRYQRHLFEIIIMALRGQVYFVGTAQDIRHVKDQEES